MNFLYIYPRCYFPIMNIPKIPQISNFIHKMPKCQAIKYDGKQCVYNAKPEYENLFCGIHKKEYSKRIESIRKYSEEDNYLCMFGGCQQPALIADIRYCYDHHCPLCKKMKNTNAKYCSVCEILNSNESKTVIHNTILKKSENSLPNETKNDSKAKQKIGTHIDIPKTECFPSNGIKFVDLFCGIGSFHYSFKKLGFECVMACDIDESVRQTYKQNYNIAPLHDVKSIDPLLIPEYDILCAGFPCQPFSQCGKHEGFNDERSNTFFEIIRIVSLNQPKIVILENVKALLNHNKGETFSLMRDKLASIGYLSNFKILKCSDYGLPQNRERLFVICVRKNTPLLKHMFKLFDFEEYRNRITLSQFFARNFEREFSYTIRCGGRRSPINSKQNWDGYMVDNCEYRLTIEDCLKLQGFEEDFKLTGSEKDKWRHLGNTIPTIFTKMIGLNIIKYY